ncbi:MAG: hypothetical protein ACOCUS_02445 [Polyangiales bacterium]
MIPTWDVRGRRNVTRTKMRIALGATGLALGGLALAGTALAQDMDTDETSVTSRSDVQIRIDSLPGTSGQRLKDLAGAIGGQMRAVRQCYAEVVEERPTVEGELSMKVKLPKKGGAQVSVDEDDTDDRPLLRCVRGALDDGSYDEVDRPAGAKAILTFRNSAAEGASRTAERRKKERQVNIELNAEGEPEAEGGTPDGRVRFTVVGGSRDDAQQVAAVYRGVRSSLPSLLDCRRRSGVRNMSPVGELELRMRVSRRGRARARTTKNTLEAGKRASRCVERAVRQMRFKREAAGTVELELRFRNRSSGG